MFRKLYYLFFCFFCLSCNNTGHPKAENILLDADSSINKNLKQTLLLTPQETSGNLGQITFSQNDKTIFHFDTKTEKGTIILNNQEYIINECNINHQTNTYTLIGKNLKIVASNCMFQENDGSDCNYASCKNVIILLSSQELILSNVDIQDCPDY